MDKAVPTQGTRHLLISKSNAPSPKHSFRELWLNRLPLSLRSGGLSETCQHQQTRPAGRADSRPPAGDVSYSPLSSGAAHPCFEKYRVQHVTTATAAQTNRGLFAQQLSRAASAAPHLQGGVRNSSPPPRLSRSQPGRKQRRTAQRCSAGCPRCACLGAAEGSGDSAFQQSFKMSCCLKEHTDNDQELHVLNRKGGSITLMKA